MTTYKLIINNNKSLKLNERQFALVELINRLGFVNFDQLTLLWSIFNRSFVSFSYSMLRRWIQNYGLLKKFIPHKKRTMDIQHPAYFVSSTGIKLLAKYHVFYRPLKYLRINAHNEQTNEVTIQSLFSLIFNQYLKKRDKAEGINQLIASDFDLTQLNLEPFETQVANSKSYPFVPDQIISYRKKQVFVELDNRTESDKVDLQKIWNYFNYAFRNPQKQILLVIAISDGSLPTKRIKSYSPVFKKISSLLTKFLKLNFLAPDGSKHSWGEMYRKIKNLTITIAGVSEAHIDIADFIADKQDINLIVAAVNNLAQDLTLKTGDKIIFSPVKKGNFTNNWFMNLSKTIGYLIYKRKPLIYQPVKIGCEHSLDSFLDMADNEQNNILIAYPPRIRKLGIPVISSFYKGKNLQQELSPYQMMYYQPIFKINENPYLLCHLVYFQFCFARYFYNFFRTGNIAADDKNDYSKLHCLHPNKNTIKEVNNYLRIFKIRIPNRTPKKWSDLHRIACTTDSVQDFIHQLGPQDLPFEVIDAILNQIKIRAYALPACCRLPFMDKLNVPQDFTPADNLYLPDAVNPKLRKKIVVLRFC